MGERPERWCRDRKHLKRRYRLKGGKKDWCARVELEGTPSPTCWAGSGIGRRKDWAKEKFTAGHWLSPSPPPPAPRTAHPPFLSPSTFFSFFSTRQKNEFQQWLTKPFLHPSLDKYIPLTQKWHRPKFVFFPPRSKWRKSFFFKKAYRCVCLVWT